MSTPLRVLILEDNPADSEMVLRELRRAGFEPEWECVESEAAFKERLRPGLDIILSDFVMPQFSAPRALEVLQATGLETPFIILSGTVGEDVAVEVMRRGAADYLLKDRLTRLGPAVSQAIEKVRLLRESRQAAEALHESRQRLAGIVTSAMDAILTLDEDQHIVLANPAAERMFGYTTADLQGQFLQMLMPERYRATHSFEIAEFRKSGDTGISGSLRALTGLRKNGEEFPIEASLSRFESAGRWFVIAILRDVTERAQAEAHVRRLNAELEQRVIARTSELESANEKLVTYSSVVSDALRTAEAAHQAKSSFLATMSHELRTPLNSILGFTDIILEGLSGPLNPEQAKQLTMVRGSARHLLNLINDVLDFSRIEAGKFEIRAESFDLRAMVDRVAASLKPQADKKGLMLTAVVAPAVSQMVSDRLRVEQILLNLLSNAVKFTELGGVTLNVDAFTDLQSASGPAPHPAIRFRVSDSGMGVRPEVLATLFEAYRQAESGRSRANEGTGLGLAISRRLATLLGGDIFAVSEFGKGSTFTLILPLVKEAGAVLKPGR